MPKSLLSDYSAREITGEVLLYETRARLLAALGSHWTKSNKSIVWLCSETDWERQRQAERQVGVLGVSIIVEAVKRVDCWKYQRVQDLKKKKNWSLIFCPYFSYTSPVYDFSFIGLLHPLSKIIWCKYNRTDLKSPVCKYSSWHTRTWPWAKNAKL